MLGYATSSPNYRRARPTQTSGFGCCSIPCRTRFAAKHLLTSRLTAVQHNAPAASTSARAPKIALTMDRDRVHAQRQPHSQTGRRSWRDERPQIKAASGRADRAQPPPVPDQGRSRSARAGDRLAVQLPRARLLLAMGEPRRAAPASGRPRPWRASPRDHALKMVWSGITVYRLMGTRCGAYGGGFAVRSTPGHQRPHEAYRF